MRGLSRLLDRLPSWLIVAVLVVATALVGLYLLRESMRGPACGFGCPVSSVSSAPGP